jgi:hypothetical protein
MNYLALIKERKAIYSVIGVLCIEICIKKVMNFIANFFGIFLPKLKKKSSSNLN